MKNTNKETLLEKIETLKSEWDFWVYQGVQSPKDWGMSEKEAHLWAIKEIKEIISKIKEIEKQIEENK